MFYFTRDDITATIKPVMFEPDCVLKGTHWQVTIPIEEDCTQLVSQLREEAASFNVALIMITTPEKADSYTEYGFSLFAQWKQHYEDPCETVIMGIMPPNNWYFHP